MKHILEEIHDRSLWQILGLYLASSWVVLQVVDTLNSVIGLPPWVTDATIALLLIGLPIVLVTAFVQKGWGRGRDAAPGRAADAEGGRRLFTWKRALLGGVAAFALLGVGSAIWMGMRAAGIGPAGTLVAKGVLEERDLILLADFRNTTSDSTLADVITEALRVDLSQSEAVQLADDGFISSALGRMGREGSRAIPEDLAREIARREGVKAVVTGEVARAGSGYALTARVVTPEEGEILVSHRESARDSTELLDAIDALSNHLRERIGDPLRQLAGSPPLAQVTTSDLEALRAYTRASRLPDADAQRRIEMFEQAVAADSTFAMAWNALGIQLANYAVQPGRAMEARTRAFELRDRLTERERNAVASMYYIGVLAEPRQAIPYLEAMVDADSTDAAALNNLGEAYRNLGDLETALGLYERAIAVDSAVQAIPWMNVAQVRGSRGELEEALEAASALETAAPGPFAAWHRAMVAAVGRDYEAAERAMRASQEAAAASPFIHAATLTWLGSIVATRGRLAEARDIVEEGAATHAANGSGDEALRRLVFGLSSIDFAAGSEARDDLDAALARYPLAELEPIERPYLDVAEAYALRGHPGEARRLVEEFEASTPADFQRGLRHLRSRVLGEVALREGRLDAAIEEFRQSGHRPQELEPMVHLARAFDAAGQADSALAHYRRFLGASHEFAPLVHWKFLGISLERAAELAYEAGELREAAGYLAELVELWRDADPVLQPRVDAAQARLQEIANEIG